MLRDFHFLQHRAQHDEVPYAILLAAIAFPLEFVPLVGPLAAAVTIVVVSVAHRLPHVLWLVFFLGVYRIFQDYVFSPHLMSQGVELHPLMIIFGVLAGGEIGGVAGIFLSVPICADPSALSPPVSRSQAQLLTSHALNL